MWVMLLLILSEPDMVKDIRVIPGLYRTQASCYNSMLTNKPFEERYRNVDWTCIKVENTNDD